MRSPLDAVSSSYFHAGEEPQAATRGYIWSVHSDTPGDRSEAEHGLHGNIPEVTMSVLPRGAAGRSALFGLALLAALAHASYATPARPDVMPPGDVREGMTGYGLTVFHGTAIDTFGVEILAVLRNFGVQRDAIVARLSGGPLAETGVAQGMSGSPVYIDGKLIGAVAWISSFTKQPLAGITPYEYMEIIPDRPMTRPDARRYTGAPINPFDFRDSLPETGGRRAPSTGPLTESLRLPGSWASEPGLAPYAGSELVPIRTPVMVTGMAPEVVGELGEYLSRYGMNVVQGGTAASDSLNDVEIAPGASLGVALMTGDLSMFAVGTVTTCIGDTVLGFGHPMYFRGQIDFPMASAYVHFLWPSQNISFKLASGGPVVGSIRQDRRYGIAGVLGEIPDMLPVEVKIAGGPQPHTVRYQVVRDRDMTPNIVGYGLLAALYDLEKLAGPAALELTTRIEIAGQEPILRTNFYTDDGGIARAAMAAAAPLQYLSRNPFEPVHVDRVTFEVDFAETIDAAFITGLELPRRVVRPGEPVVVRTLLQTYLGDEFSVTTELPIDGETPDGVYMLRVGGGSEAVRWTVDRMPGRFMPEDLPHLIDVLNFDERNDRLHLEIADRQLGMTVEDRVLPGLPHTTFETLRHAVPAGKIGPVFGDPLVEHEEPADLYIVGEREITIAVYRFARPR